MQKTSAENESIVVVSWQKSVVCSTRADRTKSCANRQGTRVMPSATPTAHAILHLVLCTVPPPFVYYYPSLVSLTMAAPFHRCAGCLGEFSSSGYERHLRTTTKPACAALRSRSQVYESSDEDIADVPPDGSDPLPFEGDALGHYDDDYWDQYIEYQGPDDEDDDPVAEPMDQDDPADLDEDDEDADEGLHFATDETDDEDRMLDEEEVQNLAAEHEWEPPIPAEEDDFPPAASEDSDLADAGRSGPDRREQRRAHEHLRTTTHIVAFPGGSAGSPIHIRLEGSSYNAYCNALESPSSPNPFAPFRSQIDWEVAKWAKTRGPGSTAVTELLQIEGVSCITVTAISTTHTHSYIACIIAWALIQEHARA